MLGERALPLLTALSKGETVDATPKELDELTGFGLAATADPTALEWARDFDELSTKYESTTATQAREALAALTEKLRSDVHRMSTRDSVLQKEELEAARLRRLIGVMEDAAAMAALEGGRAVLATKGAKSTTRDGRPVVLTPRGYAVALALFARIARYERRPLSTFVERFDRSQDGMKQLAADREYLTSRLDLPKGKDAVALGLLKLGVPAKQALQTYQAARSKLRLGPPREYPHVAVALLRNKQPDEATTQAAARLQKAREALKARRLGNEDDMRGAAKVLLPFPDLETAANRFEALVTALSRPGLDGRPIRFAARLISAHGTPAEIASRCVAASRLLWPEQEPPPRISQVPVVLAASTSSEAEVGEAVARYNEIRELLFQLEPAPPTLGDGVADLVAYKGTPREVVDLVARLTATLSGGALQPGWAHSPAFETACGLAKRFAY